VVAVADAAVVEHSIFPVDEAGLGGAAAVLWGLGWYGNGGRGVCALVEEFGGRAGGCVSGDGRGGACGGGKGRGGECVGGERRGGKRMGGECEEGGEEGVEEGVDGHFRGSRSRWDGVPLLFDGQVLAVKNAQKPQ